MVGAWVGVFYFFRQGAYHVDNRNSTVLSCFSVCDDYHKNDAERMCGRGASAMSTDRVGSQSTDGSGYTPDVVRKL